MLKRGFSKAKGEARGHGDIDLCVVSLEFVKDPIAEMAHLKSLTWDINPSIEVMPYSPEDFTVGEDPLACEINKHGQGIRV